MDSRTGAVCYEYIFLSGRGIEQRARQRRSSQLRGRRDELLERGAAYAQLAGCAAVFLEGELNCNVDAVRSDHLRS